MGAFKFIVVICALVFSADALAADTVGAVDRARGDARISHGGQERALKTQDAVKWLDTLLTGQDTRLSVAFIDGSALTLGDHSELSVDEMVYEPGTQGDMVLRLTQGVFRMVTGQINKVPDGRLTLFTPMATIGVRGTDFGGQQTPKKLLMALLDDGEVTINADGGTVTLTEPGSAVIIEHGRAPNDGHAVGKGRRQCGNIDLCTSDLR